MNEPMSNRSESSARRTPTRVYWIHALTPLHVGSGRGVGFIDLPIMREAVTNWPFVPGSSVKGVLADHHDAHATSRNELQRAAFGVARDDDNRAGALVFTDARLICFPVKSLYGTFAWCTSPLALTRWRRDVDPENRTGWGTPPQVGGSQLAVPPGPPYATRLAQNGKAYFEDLDFDVRNDTIAATYADAIAKQAFSSPEWQALFRERFAVVADEVFDFLCETATQVDARIRIDEASKTVADGQLWYEESLPAETLVSGLVWCAPLKNGAGSQDELIQNYCTNTLNLQMGGKASVGRGQVALRFADLPTIAQKG